MRKDTILLSKSGMDGGERDETSQNTQPQAMLTTAITRANTYRGVVNVPGYESKANMSIRKANAAEEVRPSTSTRRRGEHGPASDRHDAHMP